MIKRILFVGRATAEICGPWDDFAMISIGEPGASEGDPVIQDGWHDTLQLIFHDITPDTPDPDQAYTLMTLDDAKKIVEFVRKVAPNANGIIVHCRAGISRSAAIAKWISAEYKLQFNQSYRKFNDHVFRQLVIASDEIEAKNDS